MCSAVSTSSDRLLEERRDTVRAIGGERVFVLVLVCSAYLLSCVGVVDEHEAVEWVAERARQHRRAELARVGVREQVVFAAVHTAVRRVHEALLELLVREHLLPVMVHLRARHAAPL